MKRKLFSIVVMLALIFISLMPMTALADTEVTELNITTTGYAFGGSVGDINTVIAESDCFSKTKITIHCYEVSESWVECGEHDKIDPHKQYGIEILLEPKDGYTVAGLQKDNVKVNGEVPNYFDNPAKPHKIPAGWKNTTIRVWHFFPGDPERKPKKMTFDLDGGSAPADKPDVFNSYMTILRYKGGDTVEPAEFNWFKDVVPEKPGFDFKGWKYGLAETADTAPYHTFDGYYDFVSGIPLAPSSPSDEYVIRFIADWKAEGSHDPQQIKKLTVQILNFTDGNILDNVTLAYLSDPIESMSLEKVFICYYDPSKNLHRIESSEYVIDSKYDYWFQLFFTPKDGFTMDGFNPDNGDAEAYVNGTLPKHMELWNPCPEDILPEGLATNTFMMAITPYNSLLDAEKAAVKWDFDLDGGTEPEAHLFDTHKSAYLYKQGDTVLPEEFAYFKDKNPKKAGFTFNGWEYRICEYDLDAPHSISAPLGKYTAAASTFDFEAGILLDEALSELPGANSPKSYYIRFKARWKKDYTPVTPGGTPVTPVTPGGTP